MLGETHRKIARKIAVLLGLGKRETSLLETGSTAPDEWENFPHHRDKELEIIRNILYSRMLFLSGDDECFYHLGVALHYIQDKWTTAPRLKDKHTAWEIKIDSAPFLEDLDLEKAIREVLIPKKAEEAYISFLDSTSKGVGSITAEECKLRFCTKTYTLKGLCGKVISFALLNRPTSWGSVAIDLNFAYKISYETSRFVALPPNEEISIVNSQILDLKKELTSAISRTEGFPKSYFGESHSLVDLGEVIEISEKDIAQNKPSYTFGIGV
ncbi:MAG: hypothetical protein ACE14S_10385 [Candidatus Bathyarchaeia archaeon]